VGAAQSEAVEAVEAVERSLEEVVERSLEEVVEQSLVAEGSEQQEEGSEQQEGSERQEEDSERQEEDSEQQEDCSEAQAHWEQARQQEARSQESQARQPTCTRTRDHNMSLRRTVHALLVLTGCRKRVRRSRKRTTEKQAKNSSFFPFVPFLFVFLSSEKNV
jgi:hypothetical protein